MWGELNTATRRASLCLGFELAINAEQKQCLKGGRPVVVQCLCLQHICFPAKKSLRGSCAEPTLCFLDPLPGLLPWHADVPTQSRAEQSSAEMLKRCLVRGAWSSGSQCLILISPEIFLLCSAMATAPMLTSKCGQAPPCVAETLFLLKALFTA